MWLILILIMLLNCDITGVWGRLQVFQSRGKQQQQGKQGQWQGRHQQQGKWKERWWHAVATCYGKGVGAAAHEGSAGVAVRVAVVVAAPM
ncbi:hypothetical protein L208DRAFT_867973 [Tricholoma matsutake]|nr:hypothetical protein L208DRAFT_867973 [Tricholoma matsutake 945]